MNAVSGCDVFTSDGRAILDFLSGILRRQSRPQPSLHHSGAQRRNGQSWAGNAAESHARNCRRPRAAVPSHRPLLQAIAKSRGNNCDRCRFVIRSSSISAMSKRELFIPQSVLQQISRRFTSGRLAFRWEPASPCELRPTTSNKNSRLCCSTASRTKCGLAHRKRTLESYFQNEGMGKR